MVSTTVWAGTGASNSAAGARDWDTPGNIGADDGSVARSPTGVGTFTAAQQSYWLVATNFGLAVDAGSTIDSLVFEVEAASIGGSFQTGMQETKIVIGGSISGSDQGYSNNFSSTSTVYQFDMLSAFQAVGGTVANLNNSGFGFAFRVRDTGAGGTATAIDQVRLAITYTPQGQPMLARWGQVPFLGGAARGTFKLFCKLWPPKPRTVVVYATLVREA